MAVADRERWLLPKESLDALLTLLRDQAYELIGPVRRDGVVRLEPVERADQLARGVCDVQGPGHYRLIENDADIYFDYVVGPDSAKRFFFPPRQELFSLHVEGERFVIDAVEKPASKLAILGVRPCDLAAIAVQDRVFGYDPQHGAAVTPSRDFRCESEVYYCQARQQSLLIAVNCRRPGGTCFCASWGTGPRVGESMAYDLAMTELRQAFVIHAGSARGAQCLAALGLRAASDAEVELESLMLDRAAEQMGRSLRTEDVADLLNRSIDSPHWDTVAQRCLSCGNCTMVCPTCFCSTVEDASDLAGDRASRTRQWDSCFTHQFSYTTAGPVRSSIRARYRQWLRHKLATWWEQFDTSGCVGCGRCITWCPVGIDLTREVESIRRYDAMEDREGVPTAILEARP